MECRATNLFGLQGERAFNDVFRSYRYAGTDVLGFRLACFPVPITNRRREGRHPGRVWGDTAASGRLTGARPGRNNGRRSGDPAAKAIRSGRGTRRSTRHGPWGGGDSRVLRIVCAVNATPCQVGGSPLPLSGLGQSETHPHLCLWCCRFAITSRLCRDQPDGSVLQFVDGMLDRALQALASDGNGGAPALAPTLSGRSRVPIVRGCLPVTSSAATTTVAIPLGVTSPTPRSPFFAYLSETIPGGQRGES